MSRGEASPLSPPPPLDETLVGSLAVNLSVFLLLVVHN